MLIEFRVTNFRSFRDEQRLSMVASSDKSLPSNIVHIDAVKWPLTRSAVIYGPNASGKSNLVLAILYVRSLVLHSAKREPAGEEASSGLIPNLQPFLFDTASHGASSQFELTFLESGVRYEYGFRINKDTIEEEWLFAYTSGRAQRWFGRERLDNGEYSWYFGPKLRGEKQRFADITRPNVLFLSLAATLNNPQLSVVFDWFSKRLRVIAPFTSKQSMERFTVRKALRDQVFHQRIVDLLAQADLRISGFKATEIAPDNDPMLHMMPPELASVVRANGMPRVEVEMEHRVDGQAQPVTLDKSEESLGTQRLFTLAGPLIDALIGGRVLVIDELDDSLHPILVRRIVELFHDPDINKHGAQLIFNTHDTTLLDIQLFRRDQIWFVERNSANESQLYPLNDFSPRNKESLMRGYLYGRYGALPLIHTLRESIVNYGTPEHDTEHMNDAEA